MEAAQVAGGRISLEHDYICVHYVEQPGFLPAWISELQPGMQREHALRAHWLTSLFYRGLDC